MLARLFVIFGGLFVLVLCAALVVPYFIDWTGYRADFEREASAILGRKVTVKGDATARLLPFPSVTFSNVEVAGGPDGQPAMTAETFSMDAELAPFLRGEVLIFDMRLVHPRATIDVAGNGTVDWALRPSTPFDPGQIAIEKLTITEGQIELRHAAGGRRHLISEINSTISAKALIGPWRMNGTLRFDGMRTDVSASTGKLEADGQMRLRLKADPDAYPLIIETDGNAGIVKGAAVYSGQLKISGADRNSAELRGNDGEPVKISTGKPDPGFRLNGKFALDHQKLNVDEFRFETGPLDNPYTADGKASVDLGLKPHFAVEASGAQVQFDEAVGGAAGSGFTLDQRIAAFEQTLQHMPKPTIPGTLEVRLPAVVAGDTTVRDVRLSAEPVEGGWSVKSLAATLPGRTTLEADGMLSVEDHFGFSGSLLLAVGQPSGFAAWLSKDVDEAIRRLPAAGFKAKVDLSENRQSFSDLELILGKAKFSGSIDSSQPDGAKPSVLMRLTGGEMDLDGLAAFASIFISDKGANRFSDRDLDFQIKAGPVSAVGLSADTVDTALRLREGLLEIDRLSIGGLAGASISATGRVKDFPESPTGKLNASIVAVDLKPLIDVAAQHYPDNAVLKGLASRAAAYPELFQDARIDLLTSAADNGDGSTGLALSAQGNAGGSAFSASLSGKGTADKLSEAPVSITFNARNDNATTLLALYGLPALPLGMLGHASTDLAAKGSIAGGLATSFNLTADDFRASFDGTVAETTQGPTAKGKVNLDTADIEPWLMTTGVGLPGMGTGTSTSLAADADFGNGLLVLSGLTGAINKAAVSGDVNIDAKDGLPHLAGALALDELDLDPLAVSLFGDQSFAPAKGRWPTAPFSQKSTLPFNADLDLNTSALAVGPFATAHDASFSLKLDGEGIHVSDLKAKLYGGDLTGLFDLKNTEGTGLFSGQMRLAGGDLSALLPGAGIGGSGDLSAALSTSGKSVDAMIAALSGSGTAALKGLKVDGINPDGFAAMIAKADAIGRDIDAAKTAGFAPQIAGRGSFAAGDMDIAFTVANGTVRAPPIKLDNPGATLSTDVTADLNTSTVAAKGTLTYRPGDEALVGSEPAVNFSLAGPLGATALQFDSGPLAQFLTQRALEKEQQRVEAMQAALLEKQRLRREVRYYASLQTERDRAAEELRRQEEEARQKAEAEAKAKAEAEAQAKAEADAKAKADEEARAKAEADAKAQAEADAKAKADAEAQAEAEQRAADEAAKAQAEADRKRAEQAKLEAERKAAQQAPKANQSLPGVNDGSSPAPAKPKANPFTIDNLLKSLDGG
ncbi:AsmA family protein [Mesorhizobium sp. M2D.F.Ca.ET.185.01.1.1]|uniref:AsmA family protein n=3 Tax=Mesorhizobium TaxID=68287 RepID=UPI000FCC55E1|nr:MULTISPECIES: AsmA-like C-terminal region-containing protein [unclassified Mesorhizobium]TGP80375.1 AsmA family protein [bacterium M00.F.Ca.ET.227.01.1.1]TGQ00656.1 AsmA family protein [bacterium M00.F.Ca.ET.221.01.1.1]TGQ02823.1 AsmA family protein [bacterium M00.F.Ca.ET.222.01.1.1]TGU01593.1 AsmA family protein [bacterium M00.F.Ca.ET.163.01.1.1]TGU32448.1 AsmA family protein [bacterium M00.F.Ca.ET.156.01.1.1]TGU44764.1 AsmA family protein [bacterium M00.F.Ca.ET.146.01.1.1]TGV72438.1 Asm